MRPYCGNCIYFNPADKTSVGCKCTNPALEERRNNDTASYKAPSAGQACRHFINDPNKDYFPIRPGLPGLTPEEKAAYKAAATLKAYCNNHDECDGCLFMDEREYVYYCDLEGTDICGWDLKATLKRRNGK